MKVKKLPLKTKYNFNDQNAARANAGLPTIEPKIRTCLKCQELFESIGNRVCYECNERNRAISTSLLGIEAI